MRVPKRSPGTQAGRGRARAPRTALQSASARRVNTRRPPNHPGADRGMHTPPLPAVVNALKCGCMERPCATPPARCRVAAEQLVVRCAGPADASAGGGLKCAMAALTAFMSCGARAAAAYVRCSPSRGAGLARGPIASGGRVLRVCFECVSGVSTLLGIFVRT